MTIDYITIQEGATAMPIEKWSVSVGKDGSRVVTILLPPVNTPKTPADRLADAVESYRTNRFRGEDTGLEHAMFDALEAYTSTRNGIGQTTAATFGTPPDPILVARHLLDCLTGGSLASLICLVRDMSYPGRRPPIFVPDAADNIRANLRALGEKIEE